jgi:transposase InsO family protein
MRYEHHDFSHCLYHVYRARHFALQIGILACVFEYIELFYNGVRRHSANNYKSPKQHEVDYYAQCA